MTTVYNSVLLNSTCWCFSKNFHVYVHKGYWSTAVVFWFYLWFWHWNNSFHKSFKKREVFPLLFSGRNYVNLVLILLQIFVEFSSGTIWRFLLGKFLNHELSFLNKYMAIQVIYVILDELSLPFYFLLVFSVFLCLYFLFPAFLWVTWTVF